MHPSINLSHWDESITNQLHHLQSIGLCRQLRPIHHATAPFLTYNGDHLLNLSSNNYLGLADHPTLLEAMQPITHGGAGSSRLVIGHDVPTEELEKEIASHKKTESALLLSNGYMMNAGVLSSLLEPTDAVLSDQYNHASIVDGIRLSGASHLRYRHCNLNHLETLLKKATQQGTKRILIVTETVFSMDGDIAPLSDIVFLKNKYGAALITDDAHGDGAFGLQGEGMVHHVGLEDEIDLHLGTFSKAYGVYGAYVAGRKTWINYLVHTCRSLIYTTALPPCVVLGIRKALTLVKEGTVLREMLAEKSHFLRTELVKAGFETKGSTHIIPLLIGDAKKTLRFSERLLQEKIMGVAIRPPTVPEGQSRIRFTCMANHAWEDLEKAIHCIPRIGKEMGVI